jgi:hypothetical protein
VICCIDFFIKHTNFAGCLMNIESQLSHISKPSNNLYSNFISISKLQLSLFLVCDATIFNLFRNPHSNVRGYHLVSHDPHPMDRQLPCDRRLDPHRSLRPEESTHTPGRGASLRTAHSGRPTRVPARCFCPTRCRRPPPGESLCDALAVGEV